ncbi:proto-oncogene tyrosine-protein kinase ROS-like [Ptychodera flava]|uniref:proto-oncogene tyrosine-protein kinase ROS-like n=1 Tax=Ptychodera flava TaxID=63121 RepID=UPI00396A2206
MPLTAAIYTDFNRSFCLIAVVFLSLSAGEFVSRCRNSCEHDLNETNVIDRDFSCDTPCKIHICIYGCGLWQDAIHGSCSRACNETQEFDTVSKIQHCAYGCNSAVELYVTEIKDDIGEPKAPRLQADTLTNVSLGLQWDGTSHPDVFYLVQWKYQDIPSEWAYYQGHQLLNETSIIIVDLHPYVTYLFRVIWVITSTDMLTSPSSYPITTLRSGVPSSSPTITELYSPSHSTVYIEWEQPVFINGPLTNYHLSLTEVLVENHTEIVKDVMPDTLSYTFTLLKAETFYEVKISAGNIDGRGPAAIDNVTTEAKPDVSSSTAELLYLASEELRRAVPYDHLSTLLAE